MSDPILHLAKRVAAAQRFFQFRERWQQGTYGVLSKMLEGAVTNCDFNNITRLVVLMESLQVQNDTPDS